MALVKWVGENLSRVGFKSRLEENNHGRELWAACCQVCCGVRKGSKEIRVKHKHCQLCRCSVYIHIKRKKGRDRGREGERERKGGSQKGRKRLGKCAPSSPRKCLLLAL